MAPRLSNPTTSRNFSELAKRAPHVELPSFLQSCLLEFALRRRFLKAQTLSGNLKYQLAKTSTGSFVSLYLDGEMRGCRGSYAPGKSFYRDFQRNAVSAAFADSRFQALKETEILRVQFTVDQVMGLWPIGEYSREGLRAQLQDSTLGLVVRGPGVRTVLLPSKLQELGSVSAAETYLWNKIGTSVESAPALFSLSRFRTKSWLSI